MKNRHKFYIVDITHIGKVKVYNQGFYRKTDANYARARYLSDRQTTIVRGLFLIIYRDYRVTTFPGVLLKPSERLGNNPNQQARVKRGRTLLKKYPHLKILIKQGQSRSSFYSTLARELLIS